MVGFSVDVERVVVTRWAFCRVYVTNDLSSAFRIISRKWTVKKLKTGCSKRRL